MRYLGIAVLFIAAGTIGYVLVAQHPWVLNDSDSLLHLTFLGILLGALMFGWGGLPTSGFRRGLMQMLVWGGVFGALVVGYEHRDALTLTALRTFSGLAPGEPVALNAEETVLTRARNGHFTANGRINGQRVRMLVDTGASDVALPYEVAARIGVDVASLSFTRRVLTANGEARVAPITLETVEIGGVRYANVQGSVAEPGKLPSTLLGMSFLGQLSEFSFRGDKLILRP